MIKQLPHQVRDLAYSPEFQPVGGGIRRQNTPLRVIYDIGLLPFKISLRGVNELKDVLTGVAKHRGIDQRHMPGVRTVCTEIPPRYIIHKPHRPVGNTCEAPHHVYAFCFKVCIFSGNRVHRTQSLNLHCSSSGLRSWTSNTAGLTLLF